jgi:hypothetical protein
MDGVGMVMVVMMVGTTGVRRAHPSFFDRCFLPGEFGLQRAIVATSPRDPASGDARVEVAERGDVSVP